MDELTAVVDLVRSKPQIPRGINDRVQALAPNLRSFLPISRVKKNGKEIEIWTREIGEGGEVFDVSVAGGRYAITHAGNWEE